jgi:protein O-GlcNAc transferase
MDINEALQSAFEYFQAGNLQQAENICREILKVQSDNADALHLLGLINYQLKNYDLTIKYIKETLQINPTDADAYFNMGNAFDEKGQSDEAIACYKKAVEIDPDFAKAYNNLGIAFEEKGQLDEAISYYQKAIKIDPNFAEAYDNLGDVLKEKGQSDEATACYKKAIEIDPDIMETYYYLGRDLLNEGKIDDSIGAFDKALKYRPDFVKARWARCMSQLKIIYPDQSSIQISRSRYQEELIKLQKSVSLETKKDIETAAEAVGIYQPFHLAYQGFNNRELQQIYGNLVCRIMSLRYPQFAKRPEMPPCICADPIRIGIVSGYFYLHSTWKIPIKGWIENLDKQKFKLFGYYTGRMKDQETEAARNCFNRFVENIYSVQELGEIIRRDNLHILIYPEIGMNPVALRLATLRLAPVQCTSWGHPDTSGLPTIDYYLSSDLIEPPEADEHYTERLIRLPNLSIYYTPPEIPILDLDRNTFSLRPTSIIYHCCQYLFKFLPQYDEVFPRIAQKVGDCQFLFASDPRGSFINKQFHIRIRHAFNRFNLDSDDYVVFLPHLDLKKYYAIYGVADILLDPIGWSGCNTSFEAITNNLPIVTFPSMFMRGRESAAILTMMGIEGTIAMSIDDYVSIAVKLGQDSEWRRYISDKILENKHLVYRDRTCITALEEFLEKIVKNSLG